MAFNKYMHPHNIYAKKKPNFKDLACKYKEFRDNATTDITGKVHIDFKKPECLRALSCALLKDDFNLDVDIPLNRLIPTIPLRLNYLHWLEDIIGKKADVIGVDIGCGASCIYPLLGAKLNSWKFIATEVDAENIQFARKNVEKNGFNDKIEIVVVNESSRLYDVVKDRLEVFEFCMCNPPFFINNLEAYSLTTTRKPDERSEPHSISTADDVESITEGGEVEFVSKLIEDSIKLKDKIKIYTTMLGKKSSVGCLKTILRENKIKNVGSYELAQGRTMRYGLAWTFNPDVKFPVSPFKQSKSKSDPNFTYLVPNDVKTVDYTVESIGRKLEAILTELQIMHTVIMTNKFVWSLEASAKQNTWSHQRRKRRKLIRKQELPKKIKTENSHQHVSSNSAPDIDKNQNISSSIIQGETDKNVSTDGNMTNIVSTIAVTNCTTETSVMPSIMKHTESANIPSTNTFCTENLIVKFWLTTRINKGKIEVELQWRGGTQKDCLHQILQLIKNKLI